MEQSHGYVTKLKDYVGPVDRISPYHFYMHTYWRLRGTWRHRLYDWTRREACDASATIAPQSIVAGDRRTITVTVTLGPTPLRTGGHVAVYFPIDCGGEAWRSSLMLFQGPDGQTGYGSRIVARSAVEGIALETIVHSTGAVFTCVEVIVTDGTLNEGETLEIIIGDPSCKLPVLSEKAKSFPFRVAIDYAGDDTYLPIAPMPVIRCVGSAASHLRVYAPATPRSGEPFDLRIVAADHCNHNPSHTYTGRIELETTEGAPAGTPGGVDIPASEHGTVLVEGVQVADSGVTRLLAIDRQAGLMGRSNPICPDAAPDGLSCFYGEIHSHTELSDGGGLPADSLRWARDVEGLDFSALADHFEDGQSYNYTLEDKWRITREEIERFNAPGRFVTLLGYEIGTVEQHRNVYFADGEGRMIVEGPDGECVTMDNVFEKLADTDYILIPHAPKFHGINWHRPHDPARQRLVEIFSYWGDSEEGGPRSVRHALDLGYRFGFTGGTDNHFAEAGNPTIGGITGVWATELTRRAIFDALLARRTFATTGPRMLLTFRVGDTQMGGERRAALDEPTRIHVRAITCAPIERIDIVRNGDIVYSAPGKGEDTILEWEDPAPLTDCLPARELSPDRYAYYYARVVTVDGARGWTSPVWVFA